MFWKWRCLLQKPSVTLLTVGAPAKLCSLHRVRLGKPFEIELLQLKLYRSDKINNMKQCGTAKNNWNLTKKLDVHFSAEK